MRTDLPRLRRGGVGLEIARSTRGDEVICQFTEAVSVAPFVKYGSSGWTHLTLSRFFAGEHFFQQTCTYRAPNYGGRAQIGRARLLKTTQWDVIVKITPDVSVLSNVQWRRVSSVPRTWTSVPGTRTDVSTSVTTSRAATGARAGSATCSSTDNDVRVSVTGDRGVRVSLIGLTEVAGRV